MGVTVALPFLDAMVPARAALAQGPASRVRFAAIEMVHGAAGSTKIGIDKNMWSPAATGRAFDLTPTSLSPLEPFRDHLTIVSNTDVRNAEAFGAGDWRRSLRSSAVFLTQMHPRQTQGSDVRVGTHSISSSPRSTGRTRPSPRCSCASRMSIRLAVVPTVTRASTPTPSAGRRRRIRCRWCATRARCSTCCSASARRRRSAPSAAGGPQYPGLDSRRHVAVAQHAG